MKRAFDITLSFILILIMLFPMLCIAVLIRLTSRGPALYWSDRVGKMNIVFKMPKFRTMSVDTPAIATHLLADPQQYQTRIGKVLRKYSLDEAPQLLSILKGDMSFVGPRPALFNQQDLIALRTDANVHLLPPGLTGLAQINGRDDISIRQKVEFDQRYLDTRSFWLDMKILWLTAIKVIKTEDVRL